MSFNIEKGFPPTTTERVSFFLLLLPSSQNLFPSFSPHLPKKHRSTLTAPGPPSRTAPAPCAQSPSSRFPAATGPGKSRAPPLPATPCAPRSSFWRRRARARRRPPRRRARRSACGGCRCGRSRPWPPSRSRYRDLEIFRDFVSGP